MLRQIKNDSANTNLPIGWSWRRLSDLCVEDRHLVEPGSELARQLPYLSLEDIESHTGRIRRLDDLAATQGQSTTFAFDSRHLLYGKLRPYLNKVALPDFAGRCTTELIPFLPRANISRRYLGWLFRRPETVAFAMKGKTGSRMPRANIKELLTLPVAIPDSLEAQERLAAQIDADMMQLEIAKAAIKEQMEIIKELGDRILTDFPLNTKFSR